MHEHTFLGIFANLVVDLALLLIYTWRLFRDGDCEGRPSAWNATWYFIALILVIGWAITLGVYLEKVKL
jgi:hypothetical protein